MVECSLFHFAFCVERCKSGYSCGWSWNLAWCVTKTVKRAWQPAVLLAALSINTEA